MMGTSTLADEGTLRPVSSSHDVAKLNAKTMKTTALRRAVNDGGRRLRLAAQVLIPGKHPLAMNVKMAGESFNDARLLAAADVSIETGLPCRRSASSAMPCSCTPSGWTERSDAALAAAFLVRKRSRMRQPDVAQLVRGEPRNGDPVSPCLAGYAQSARQLFEGAMQGQGKS
jgi:hypothetical protein